MTPNDPSDNDQTSPKANIFNRPGVSDVFLQTAGCAHIGDDACAKTFGFKAAGICIPFRHLDGTPIVDGDRPFARVRLYDATETQKYSQRGRSGVHIFIPPGFKDSLKKSTVFLVEGEFKAAALMEAGFAALGICGITGACQSVDGEATLNSELVKILQSHQPARLVFLGDSDVVLNAQFAAEAAKLFKLVRKDRRLQFVESYLIAKPPVDGEKGVDDCRQAYGEKFAKWFSELSQVAYSVPAKATALDIHIDLLKREEEALALMFMSEGPELRHARTKLLSAAARFWGEVSGVVELLPLLCSILGLNKSEVNSAVKTIVSEAKSKASESVKQNKPTTEQIGLEPWPEPIDGAELLEQIHSTLNRFLSLPAQVDVLLAIWALHTYVFDLFGYTPYLHITSPEGGCGKSTVAELLQHLCVSATTPGGMSAAAMFRRIDKKRPTLLLDEWDTLSDGNRQAALNVLNTGFKYNGVYTICVGDEHEEHEFKTFCPKAIFGLAAAKLPDTTRSRSFTFALQKKLPSEKLEKLTRKFDATNLRRKCLRWAKDNAEKLSAAEPVMPPELGARQEDISEPLLAVADACGGRWPESIRACVSHFFASANAAESGIGVELLKDIHCIFDQHGHQIGSAALVERLNALDDRPWGGWSDGRGISVRQIATKLHPFGIAPRNLWEHMRCIKGYHSDDFAEAFTRYLSIQPDLSRESARGAANTSQHSDFASASVIGPSGAETELEANNDGGSRALADNKPVEAEMEVMRI
jgi:putative DNA primase/helicase